VAVTASLGAAQVLQLRRATKMDGETAALLSEQQFDTVFQLILTTKLQALAPDVMEEVKKTGGVSLLPPFGPTYPESFREQDKKILGQLLSQMFPTHTAPPEVKRAVSAEEKNAELQAQAAKAAAAKVSTGADQAIAAGKPAEGVGTLFAKVFDDGICEHVATVFKFFQVTAQEKGSTKLPYALAPEFSENFQSVLRQFVLPSLRASRMVAALGTSYNWEDNGKEKILDIILSGESKNPIFYAWDDRWSGLQLPKPPKVEDKKGAGGLFGKLKGKKEAPVVLTKAQKDREDLAKNVWGALKEGAKKHGYYSPTEQDIAVFETLLKYDTALIQKAWDEIANLYQQEFEPKGHQDSGREGSFRDGLNKWHNRLPPHAGEFLALRCFFTYKKCDINFMKKFSVTHGVSKEERIRQIPYMMEFLTQFG